MLEWNAVDDNIRVVDANNTELTVAGADLTVGDRTPTVPRPVDTTLKVRTRELRFSHAVVYVFSLDADEQYELDPSGDSLSLSSDEFLLSLECYSTGAIGSYYYPRVESNEHAFLCETESNFTVDRTDLVSFLRESETPVVYDGDV